MLYEIISVADRQSPCGVFICPGKVKVVKTEKRKQFPFFKKRGKPRRVAGIETLRRQFVKTARGILCV